MLWIAVVLLLLVSSVLVWVLSRPSESDITLQRLQILAGVRGNGVVAGQQAAEPETKPKESLMIGRDREEIARLLAQAGWAEGVGAVRYKLMSVLLPLILGLGGAFAVWLQDPQLLKVAQTGGVLAIAGVLLPRRILRGAAKSRMQTMQLEVPQFALLLRMLLDTGMTLEHALHIIVTQADQVIPVISTELLPVVRRMKAGQEMNDALQIFRTVFEQAELHDIFLMLRQASEQGGNVRDSITSYVEDMEKRLLTQLREYVSKLSGKMSLVMMLLLFPALLMIVAGPAMLAMVRGLSGIG